MLTKLERERLENRDAATSKQNDFIVRRKLKAWLDDLLTVSFVICRHLPQRQIQKLITYRHVNELANLIGHFIWLLGAVPITQIDGRDMVVIPGKTPREVDGIEGLLRGEIKLLINNLFRFLSSEDVRDVIRTEIDFHQSDYALMKRASLKEPKTREEPPK